MTNIAKRRAAQCPDDWSIPPGNLPYMSRLRSSALATLQHVTLHLLMFSRMYHVLSVASVITWSRLAVALLKEIFNSDDDTYSPGDSDVLEDNL
jgi:hypothetical protein